MKKIIAILLSMLVGATLFAGCGDKKETTKEQQKQVENKQESNNKKPIDANIENVSTLEIKPLLSANGNNKIGEFGISYYTNKINSKDLIKFYNVCVKDRNLKFVMLVNKDNKKGYVFHKESNQFEYGKVEQDEKGALSITKEKEGYIKGDKIEYIKSK